MYIAILEQYGDFGMAYPVAVYVTDTPFDLQKIKSEFKSHFDLDVIDNSTQTMELFKDYIKKMYGLIPHYFKCYTIAED